MKQRLGFAVVELLVALLPFFVSVPSHLSKGKELLVDPHFQRGFVVYAPASGKHVVTGTLQPPVTPEKPAWGLAQWYSKFNLAGARPEVLPYCAFKFADQAKSVTLSPPGTPDSDLILAVNAKAEYGLHARRKRDPWVHLLASQRLKATPNLAEMKHLYFTISARLLYSRLYKTPDYNPRLHAAQFVCFITVQNLNRDSSGYGDFVWFGIPLYDDRFYLPKRFIAPDRALKKLIYTPPGEVYTTQSLHSHQGVEITSDLLPLMKQALAEAWRRGILEDSHNLADYRPAAFSLG